MKTILQKYKDIFESQLDDYLSNHSCDIQPIFEAVVYSLKNGGKRIRPILCYLGAEFCGKKPQDVANLAIGMEMIHSYSLVHDDLPCMDDDELRRGMPTTHKKYGEGMAVLAGDALLNMAFEVFLEDNNFDINSLKALRYISYNSGINGMIGGQCIDLSNDSNNALQIEDLRRLYKLKTSCLLKSALIGAIIKCGGSEEEINDMQSFASNLGEIFQIVDDILDKTSTKEILGKDVNQDSSNQKTTIVDILGIDKSREYIKQIESDAINSIQKYGIRAKKLIDLCYYLTNRIN